VVCSHSASSFGFRLAGIVGCAWMACLQAATACCSPGLLVPGLLAPALPGAGPLGVLVVGVECVPAPAGPLAGVRAGAGAPLAGVVCAREGVVRAPACAGLPEADVRPCRGLLAPDLERVLAATGPVPPAGLVRATAGPLAARVEPA
jgi:hypothetical protein